MFFQDRTILTSNMLLKVSEVTGFDNCAEWIGTSILGVKKYPLVINGGLMGFHGGLMGSNGNSWRFNLW